jgi:hypothetical protein
MTNLGRDKIRKRTCCHLVQKHYHPPLPLSKNQRIKMHKTTTLRVLPFGRETAFLAARDGHRSREFEKEVERREAGQTTGDGDNYTVRSFILQSLLQTLLQCLQQGRRDGLHA